MCAPCLNRWHCPHIPLGKILIKLRFCSEAGVLITQTSTHTKSDDYTHTHTAHTDTPTQTLGSYTACV